MRLGSVLDAWPRVLALLRPCEDDFSNVELVAHEYGWKKVLGKSGPKKKASPGNQPELDLASRPQYSAQRLCPGVCCPGNGRLRSDGSFLVTNSSGKCHTLGLCSVPLSMIYREGKYQMRLPESNLTTEQLGFHDTLELLSLRVTMTLDEIFNTPTGVFNWFAKLAPRLHLFLPRSKMPPLLGRALRHPPHGAEVGAGLLQHVRRPIRLRSQKRLTAQAWRKAIG